jgi:hypothetical protein
MKFSEKTLAETEKTGYSHTAQLNYRVKYLKRKRGLDI